MKFTGKIIRMGKNGKIKIPHKLLKIVGLKKDAPAEILPFEHGIALQKPILKCLVTGEISDDVKEVLPGIYLSNRGMDILLNELMK